MLFPPARRDPFRSNTICSFAQQVIIISILSSSSPLSLITALLHNDSPFQTGFWLLQSRNCPAETNYDAMASRPRPSLADSSYPESTYAETYDEGSYASSSEGGGSAMLSRRAPSIQSSLSRRRFEEYSVTEPSISKCSNCIHSQAIVFATRTHNVAFSSLISILCDINRPHWAEEALQARYSCSARDPQVSEIHRSFAAQASVRSPRKGDRQRLCNILRARRVWLGSTLAEFRHLSIARSYRGFPCPPVRRCVSARYSAQAMPQPAARLTSF